MGRVNLPYRCGKGHANVDTHSATQDNFVQLNVKNMTCRVRPDSPAKVGKHYLANVTPASFAISPSDSFPSALFNNGRQDNMISLNSKGCRNDLGLHLELATYQSHHPQQCVTLRDKGLRQGLLLARRQKAIHIKTAYRRGSQRTRGSGGQGVTFRSRNERFV